MTGSAKNSARKTKSCDYRCGVGRLQLTNLLVLSGQSSCALDGVQRGGRDGSSGCGVVDEVDV